MLVTAGLIKLTSPGPLIYKQERVGLHNRPFNMYKFRSMEVQEPDKEKGKWTTPHDPRVTPVGRFIRKTSIDEMPQLFNVLIGNMSIVGPRPALPAEVDQYSDYEKLRLIVTPGITCTWQITQNRNDMPFEKWLEMDLDYIEHRTTWQDIKIIVKTPIAMLKATGR